MTISDTEDRNINHRRGNLKSGKKHNSLWKSWYKIAGLLIVKIVASQCKQLSLPIGAVDTNWH
jgi:hypothetical protein